jgi:hypothetical protein
MPSIGVFVKVISGRLRIFTPMDDNEKDKCQENVNRHKTLVVFVMIKKKRMTMFLLVFLVLDEILKRKNNLRLRTTDEIPWELQIEK